MNELKLLGTKCAMLFIQSAVILCIVAFPLIVRGADHENEKVADDGKKFDPSKDFYQFEAEDIRGNIVPLKRYYGKVGKRVTKR